MGVWSSLSASCSSLTLFYRFQPPSSLQMLTLTSQFKEFAGLVCLPLPWDMSWKHFQASKLGQLQDLLHSHPPSFRDHCPLFDVQCFENNFFYIPLFFVCFNYSKAGPCCFSSTRGRRLMLTPESLFFVPWLSHLYLKQSIEMNS